MKKINILLTCVASQVMPEKIKLIKSFSEYDIKIVGIDMSCYELSVGAFFCDKFFQSPSGKEKGYNNFILKLVKKEKINIIFCGSDEEVLALSKIKDTLKSKFNCILISSNYKITKLTSDKHEMLKKIKEKGFHVCKFLNPRTIKDIDKFAGGIGYPKKDFIIKPKQGRGSKGFKIITSKINYKKEFFSSTSYKMTIEDLKKHFKKYPAEIKNFLLMEYLPGDKYSADILAENGQIRSIVIRNNWKDPKINPPTQVADIVFDKDIQEYAEKICNLIKANFFLQIEIGRDKNGKPAFIESNPRLDATLPITMGVGINFYHELIYYALNKKFRSNIIPREKNKKIRFFRYWDHTFIK
jgi:carbamoyl-phosphate synthase large subunit